MMTLFFIYDTNKILFPIADLKTLIFKNIYQPSNIKIYTLKTISPLKTKYINNN